MIEGKGNQARKVGDEFHATGTNVAFGRIQDPVLRSEGLNKKGSGFESGGGVITESTNNIYSSGLEINTMGGG